MSLDFLEPWLDAFRSIKNSPFLIAVSFCLFVFFDLAGRAMFESLWVFDMANLAFHEAGHPIFGLLGIRFIMMLGGTLMQLLIPAAAAVQLLRTAQPISADLVLFWFGENFLHIGRYVADARAQQLDLVGGGEHDWTYLLGETGLITHDIGLGQAVDLFGCLVMTFALLAAWVHFRERYGTKVSSPP